MLSTTFVKNMKFAKLQPYFCDGVGLRHPASPVRVMHPFASSMKLPSLNDAEKKMWNEHLVIAVTSAGFGLLLSFLLVPKEMRDKSNVSVV